MTDNLTELPPPEKKVAAKILAENGYSMRKIERVLGIDYSTASLYAKQEIPDDLQQFSTVFSGYIAEAKEVGIGMVYKRLLELIPKERRVDQVVKAGEYLEGKNQPQINTQVNIGGEMGIQFSKAE